MGPLAVGVSSRRDALAALLAPTPSCRCTARCWPSEMRCWLRVPTCSSFARCFLEHGRAAARHADAAQPARLVLQQKDVAPASVTHAAPPIAPLPNCYPTATQPLPNCYPTATQLQALERRGRRRCAGVAGAGAAQPRPCAAARRHVGCAAAAQQPAAAAGRRGALRGGATALRRALRRWRRREGQLSSPALAQDAQATFAAGH
jgi:hypothetical protein